MTRLLNLAWLLLIAIALALPTTAFADQQLAAAESAAAADDDDDEGEDEEEEEEAEDDEDDDEDEDEDDGDAEAEEKADKAKDKKKAKKKPAKKRKTATVEEKSLKVQVTVDGKFVARNMTPVALRPEAWNNFKIEEIVPHGARVRKGEVLVKFDATKLDEEMESLELSQRLAELSIRKAEEELPRVEKSLEMNLAEAKQSHERVNDDYHRYKDVDRDRFIEQAEMNLKMSRQRLDYAKDELEQLEKMYEADDLTEETEEIILTRTRQQVEFAEFFFEQAKIRHEELLSIFLPRQDEDYEEVVDRVDMSLERAKLASELDLNRARYELEQKKANRDKSLDRHAKLVQDRNLMELKSPAAGIVYYGQCINGAWSDMGSMQNKLKPYKTVPSNAVFMTIVETKPMYLLGTIGEKDLPNIEKGQSAKVRPAAEDAESLSGRVASVSDIPVSSGKFAIEVDLSGDGQPSWIVPGMSGKIRITTYDKKDALLVNKKAIQSEEDDEDKKYVWLVTKADEDDEESEAKVEKRRVKTGKKKDDLVEIVDGLEEGDVVSLEDESKRKDDE